MNEIKVKLMPDYQTIKISFPYDTALLELVKNELNPTRVNKIIYGVEKFDYWKMKLDDDSRDRLAAVKSDSRFDIDPKVWAFYDTVQEWKEKNYILSMAPESDIKVNGLAGELKKFQLATVEYVSRNMRGVLIGDEMGLGKTVEAIAALQYSEKLPALVIVPAVVKYNWLKEFKKWSPGLDSFVVNGTAPLASYIHDVLIINYDILEAHFKGLAALDWRVLILDESHYLKNYKSKRTILVSQLAAQIENKILLSGTPMLNRPQELISQLQIMGRMDDLGGFWPFANRYCKAYQRTIKGQKIWDMSGAANLDELNKKLRETCYVRHEKKEVLPELPEKSRVDLFVKLDNWPEYAKAEANVIEWIRENATIPDEIYQEADERAAYLYSQGIEQELTELAASECADELRESILNDYRESAAHKAARAEAIVKINVLRQLAAMGKIKSAAAWINNFMQEKNKLVVFCWHRKTIDALKEIFPAAGVIDGSVSLEERELIKDSFQDGTLSLLICNIQAGGVGITLTAADTSLFIESAWNPGTMEQAEDRIYRMGQRNATTIFNMIGIESIDSAMSQMIEAKRKDVNDTLDGFNYVRYFLLGKGLR